MGNKLSRDTILGPLSVFYNHQIGPDNFNLLETWKSWEEGHWKLAKLKLEASVASTEYSCHLKVMIN